MTSKTPTHSILTDHRFVPLTMQSSIRALICAMIGIGEGDTDAVFCSILESALGVVHGDLVRRERPSVLGG